jgi:hypothetical protein
VQHISEASLRREVGFGSRMHKLFETSRAS